MVKRFIKTSYYCPNCGAIASYEDTFSDDYYDITNNICVKCGSCWYMPDGVTDADEADVEALNKEIGNETV